MGNLCEIRGVCLCAFDAALLCLYTQGTRLKFGSCSLVEHPDTAVVKGNREPHRDYRRGKYGSQQHGNEEQDIKREISVEVPAAEVARETELQIQRYQKSARLPGFRTGHVPASIIRQRFGEASRMM